MKYRIYAGGTIAHEEDFNEFDNSLPYYDDYQEVNIPEELMEYLRDYFTDL